MPLRYQLLLLSLLTLLLPWAGCQYAREMEDVLREGQKRALLASANTIASIIGGKPALLKDSLAAPVADVDADAPAPGPGPFDPARGDLYAYPLRVAPLLDGYPDDWTLPEQAFTELGSPASRLSARYLVGADDTYVYLFLVVRDAVVRLEQGSNPHLPPEDRGDHAWLGFATPSGTHDAVFFATSAPGLISARRTTTSKYGERGEQLEPRIQAYWEPDTSGYRLEVRVPLELVAGRIGFEIVDANTPGGEPNRIGTLEPGSHVAIGRLMRPSSALSRELAAMLPPATRGVAGDRNGWIVGEAGVLAFAPGPGRDDDPGRQAPRPAEWLQALYRNLIESGRAELAPRGVTPGRLVGPQIESARRGIPASAWLGVRDEDRSVLSVATPIFAGTGNGPDPEILGVLMVEQEGDRLLILGDTALRRMLNVTLLATVIAVLATLIFATVLATRLGRLKRAAETALTRDGRLNVVIPGTQQRDELGDVSRSYAELLHRLNEYTSYLRTLGGKLAHELRTPLTIVRSSLENLESERAAGGSIEPYLARAREGTERLQAILGAMGAATRTEEAIQHAERARFDLRALLESTAGAYADAFPARRFETNLPSEPCWINGAPDLVVQMLDKLVDNAVDFSATGSVITLALETTEGECTLAVTNVGRPIPPATRLRLFDSMFQYRRDSANKPHFGLGLFIVRLVADFHGGRVSVENLRLEGASGEDAVCFRVTLPRMT
jgi:dedicated sortase system histidine kinase